MCLYLYELQPAATQQNSVRPHFKLHVHITPSMGALCETIVREHIGTTTANRLDVDIRAGARVRLQILIPRNNNTLHPAHV